MALASLPAEVKRRLSRPRASRLLLAAVLLAAVAWAFAWGAHEHGAPVTAADLDSTEVDRRLVVDASTGVLDLSSVAVEPGEVVEFLLEGSAGSPHRFVLTGAGGAAMDTSTAPNGDTVIRLQVPEQGGLSFFCEVPGHEGLHGSLVVDSGG